MNTKLPLVARIAAFLILGGALFELSGQNLTAKEFEDEQRAQKLVRIDSDVRTLSEPEIRLSLRLNILDFIYSRKVRSVFPSAESILVSICDDIASNEKKLDSGARSLRHRLGVLLRANAPDVLKKYEAKYSLKPDTLREDAESIRRGVNADVIVERTIARLENSRENLDLSTRDLYLITYESVQSSRSRTANADRMLDAALAKAEKQGDLAVVYLITRMFDDIFDPPGPQISLDRTLRYGRILISGASVEMAKPGAKSSLFSIFSALRAVMPRIKQADAKLYSDAVAVIAKYRTWMSAETLEKIDANDRIDTSEDPLETAITEASAAKSRSLSNELWAKASSIAVKRKQFQRAVELLMKADPDFNIKEIPLARDQSIWHRIAYPAARVKDYNAAEYAIGTIKDTGTRAMAMLDYGSEIGRFMNPRDYATNIIMNGFDLLEMTTPPPDAVCRSSNAIRSLAAAPGSTNEAYYRNMVRVVNMMNRIPATGADAKPGSPEREAYVKSTLRRVVGCSTFLFRNPEHPPFNIDPELAKRIQVPEWRLAAQIETEKTRKYPSQQ
ncbi:MAG: hypothetical protein QM785_15870 [Pyrinomonadaceae bacterium]